MHQRVVHQSLLKILLSAVSERSARRTIIDGEPGWVHYERDAMLVAVNEYRSALGKMLLLESAVRQVEQHAEGHCDYAQKFALYCAELVLA